jgi:deazaflavin-dependent oxidoreductase (nitroreductase family)
LDAFTQICFSTWLSVNLLHTQIKFSQTIIKVLNNFLEATFMSDHNDWNKQIIEEFRTNEGKVSGLFENVNLVLLHTTGAKSGLERINPLVCMLDGDRIIVCASKAGAPSNPDWYYNLVANPEVVVEFGTGEFKAKATVTKEPERTELYRKMATKFENFAEYEGKTTRVIPVIALNRL